MTYLLVDISNDKLLKITSLVQTGYEVNKQT